MISLDLLSLLLWQAIQIALLVAIVRLLVGAIGDSRPHLSHALWAIVVIKCVTPPIWSSSVGLFSHAARHVDHESIKGQLQYPLLGVDVASVARVEAAPSLRRTKDAGISAGITASISLDPVESAGGILRRNSDLLPYSTSTDTSHGQGNQNLVFWLLIIWLAGAAVSAAWLIARVIAFLAKLRRFPVVSHPEVEQAVDRLSDRFGVRRRVRVAVIDGQVGPAVLGWLRPKVLLPRVVVEGKSMEQLQPLIAHELVHVRRGDLWWAGLQEIATCVWWFHPFARLACRRLSQEAERSCDQETIAGLQCEPAAYARCLLDVLEHKKSLRAAPAFPGIRPIDITSKRMERIMHTDVLCYRRTPIWIWLVMMLISAAVLPGAKIVSAEGSASDPPENAKSAQGETTDAPVLPAPQNEPINQAKNETARPGSSQIQDGARHGLDPIRIKASILLVPEERWGDLDIDWDNAQPKLGVGSPGEGNTGVGNIGAASSNRHEDSVEGVGAESVAPISQGVDSTEPPQQPRPLPRVLPPARHDSRVSTWLPTPSYVAGDTPLPASSPILQASATTVIHQPAALHVAVVDTDPTREIMEAIPGASVVSRPQVITMNGRAATVEVFQMVPMLVGYKSVKDHDGKNLLVPVNEDVKVGTEMRLKPIIVDHRYVQLDFGLKLTRIRESIPDPSEADGDRSISQHAVPALASISVESVVSLPLGSTLAIGGLTVDEKGKLQRLLCMIRCDAADVSAGAKGKRSDSISPPPSDNASKQNDSTTNGVTKISFMQGKSLGVETDICSDFDLFGKSGIKVQIQGDIRLDHSQNKTILVGRTASISWADGDQIEADQVRLRLSPGTATHAEMQGAVRITLGNLNFQAERATVIGAKLKLERVVVASGEGRQITCKTLQITVGDHVRVETALLRRLQTGQPDG